MIKILTKTTLIQKKKSQSLNTKVIRRISFLIATLGKPTDTDKFLHGTSCEFRYCYKI